MRCFASLVLIAACGVAQDPPSPTPEEAPPEPAEETEPETPPPAEEMEHEDEEAIEEEPSANAPAPQNATPEITCRVPAIPIPRPRACERGRSYPSCKWQMPHATLSAGRYRRWRNTIMEHWWGRPGLVSFILASLDAFEERYPDQVVAVGDLDAPGPRHSTHDRGVDVDLYLLGALMVENAGAGAYPNNYEGKSEEEVEALRQRVEYLARTLAACSAGQLRIYYNDDVVRERFHAWYDEQGFEENSFGRPMQRHNRLHDFHFHVTIEEVQEVHPMEALPEGERHPIARIEAPPPPESAPHLSSMNRRRGE